jgi:hypothetical protein
MSRDFPAKTVDEVKVYTFDFAPEVAPTAVLSTPAVTQSTLAGVNPMTLVAPSIAGLKVLVLGSAGDEAGKYKLRASVNDDLGQTHVIWANAAVKESAGQAATQEATA